MGAIVSLETYTTVAGDSNPSPISQRLFKEDLDIINNPKFTDYVRACDADADGSGYITLATGIKLANGAIQTSAPAATVRAPVRAVVTDNQIAIRSGYNADGTANVTRSTLRPSANTMHVLPDGSWYYAFLGKLDTPTSAGAAWSTNDVSLRYALTCTNTGIVRFYQDYTAGTFSATGTGVNDGNLHLWEVGFDGTTLTVWKDRIPIITSTTALAAVTVRAVRTFSIPAATNDSTAPTLQGAGHYEFRAIATAPDADVRAAVRAKALQMHPGLTIAA